METPKQKAEILTDKYFNLFAVDLENTISKYEAVECAKIDVEEILSINHNVKCDAGERIVNAMVDYYEEVKNELNKLQMETVREKVIELINKELEENYEILNN